MVIEEPIKIQNCTFGTRGHSSKVWPYPWFNEHKQLIMDGCNKTLLIQKPDQFITACMCKLSNSSDKGIQIKANRNFNF